MGRPRHQSPLILQDAHLSEVNAVRFGPNSSLLATGGADCLIHLWNVVGGKAPSLLASLVLPLQTHPQPTPGWAMVLDIFVLPHLEHSCGQWLENPLVRMGLWVTILKKGRGSQLLGSRPTGWGGVSSGGSCWGRVGNSLHEVL